MSYQFLMAQASAPAIPFRTESAASGGQVFGVLFATALLLAVLWVAAQIAHRKGWLARWQAGATMPGDQGIRVVSRQRLSRHTVVHVLEFGQSRYMVVESSQTTTTLPLPLGTAPDTGRGKP